MLISKESAFSTVQSIRLNNYLYPYFEKNKTKKIEEMTSSPF
ncbi:hypothetical protein B4129_0210 [Bacillus safensis]|nr:hypothetical protein B4129_0210 [Bacillus safensis]